MSIIKGRMMANSVALMNLIGALPPDRLESWWEFIKDHPDYGTEKREYNVRVTIDGFEMDWNAFEAECLSQYASAVRREAIALLEKKWEEQIREIDIKMQDLRDVVETKFEDLKISLEKIQ